MDIESYFDFLAPDDIRIKGSRIGIESVLYEHLYRARTPEEITDQFHTITIEQVYATILYYLHNQPHIDAYIADWLEFGRLARLQQEQELAPTIQRLREYKRQHITSAAS